MGKSWQRGRTVKKKGRDQAKLEHIDRLAEQMKSSETPAAPEGEFEKLLKRVQEAAGKKHKPKG